MDKIDKALSKLVSKEKARIKNIIKALQSGRFDNLDIKKLKGLENIFRVRQGGLRIIYQTIDKEVIILKIDKRKEDTYRF
ncbi:MAG: type II toxin-antitoxin system RelE/ParE family toxin [Patescibacteria group bacterium]